MAETIGQQLKNARLARNLTIQKVVEATRIRPQYLEAMEADNFAVFPSAAQGRGFLHNYADFLGLKVEEMYARQHGETTAPEEAAPAQTVESVAAVETVSAPAPEAPPAPVPPSSPAAVAPPEIVAAEPGAETWPSIFPARQEPQEEKRPPKATGRPKARPAKETKTPATKPSGRAKGQEKKAAPPAKAGEKARRGATTAKGKTAPAKPAAKTSVGKQSPAGRPPEKKPAPAKGKPSAVKAAGKKAAAEKPATKKTTPQKTAAAKPAAKKGAVQPAAAKAGKSPSQRETPSAKRTKKRTARKLSAGKKAADEWASQPEPYRPPPIVDAEPLRQETFPPPAALPEETVTSLSEPLAEPSAPADTTSPSVSSKDIFLAIGADLRQRRELLSMTLDEVERHIHVRRHYLEAIEAGDLSGLPSSVQARGMLNNYARFLDMDADALLLRFAEGLQTQHRERHPQAVEQAGKKRSRPALPLTLHRLLSVDLLVGGGLILLFFVVIVWGIGRIVSSNRENAVQPTAPSISELLLVTPTTGAAEPTGTPTAGPAAPPTAANQTETAIAFPTGGTGHVNILLVALERAYVKVIVDGQVKFDGRIVPGTAYPYDGKERIEVLTANGAAVRITFNNTDLGVMGTYGQNVNLIFTASSVMTPTATATPTPTATPIPSPTLRPSATPRPSPTPKP